MEIRARLSDEAWSAWDRATTREGVTLTALIEAIGRELAAGWQPPKRIVIAARQIDRDRRSRR